MKGKELDGLVERLAKVRLFAGMARGEIAEVVRLIGGEVRHCKKGEAIVYEGTKAKWVVPFRHPRHRVGRRKIFRFC